MSENMISVTQFSNYVKQIFSSEELLHNILIYGEVSGFNISRGTAYFNLKDEDALLPCVRFSADELDYIPKEGDMVVVRGSPNYYVKGGRFSFVVTSIQAYGLGLLYQQFLELKAKLEAEGLFDTARKKALPKNIKRVGVVTSETGAVIQDIIDISRRRNPMLDIVLYPAKVQGVGAEATIIQGIKELDKTNVDVIIVARGGGSLEDLSCFNTEIVARAIAETVKPVISAVGHETDFTIADFVADLRAPTPSAAAEIVSIDLGALVEQLNFATRKIIASTQNYLLNERDNVFNLSDTLCNDFILYQQNKRQPIREILLKLGQRVDKNLMSNEHKVQLLVNKIEAKNPLAILKMGYITAERNSKRVTSIKEVKIGEELSLNLLDGILLTEIKEKKGEEK